MRRITLLATLTLLFSSGVWAQTRTIKGTVLNEEGTPLANVSVIAKETTEGTSTNDEGNFSLVISPDAKTLVVSAVGYTTQDVRIGQSNEYTVRLVSSTQSMEEVVVTAYGTTEKRAFTGTASTISNEKFKDLQTPTITGILQGNASGVISVTSTGQPGESPTIRIRGVGSFNASNAPLIIVDGSPYSGSIKQYQPCRCTNDHDSERCLFNRHIRITGI